jgi:hypothetical protein
MSRTTHRGRAVREPSLGLKLKLAAVSGLLVALLAFARFADLPALAPARLPVLAALLALWGLILLSAAQSARKFAGSSKAANVRTRGDLLGAIDPRLAREFLWIEKLHRGWFALDAAVGITLFLVAPAACSWLLEGRLDPFLVLLLAVVGLAVYLLFHHGLWVWVPRYYRRKRERVAPRPRCR